jgi:23S rRNA G2445 N2-methylase RlmL
MKFVLNVKKGCEELAKQEVKKIVGKKLTKKLEFTTKDILDGCKLCYLSRSITKVLMEIKDAGKYLDLDNKEHLDKYIKKKDKNIYIDFSVPSLDKRAYIVKDNPPNLSCSTAFLAANELELKKTDTVLDPLCRGGKFLIESCHFINQVPPGRFKSKFAFMDFKIFEDEDFSRLFKKWDKSKSAELNLYGMDSYTGNIENIKENLKNAKVNANISCRSIDWMDSLFEQNSVDKIIVMLPSGKHKSTEALYRELFYQSSYCLKKNGIMVVLGERDNLIKRYAEQMNFKIIKKIELNRLKLFKLKPTS